jgi:AbrB family looped-hinge helix DNA binding protein
VKATITERGQVSIPAQLRREMRLEPGQTVLWEKISETECRLIALPPERTAPDPMAALDFARQHGLEEGSSEMWLKELRAGEED